MNSPRTDRDNVFNLLLLGTLPVAALAFPQIVHLIPAVSAPNYFAAASAGVCFLLVNGVCLLISLMASYAMQGPLGGLLFGDSTPLVLTVPLSITANMLFVVPALMGWGALNVATALISWPALWAVTEMTVLNYLACLAYLLVSSRIAKFVLDRIEPSED